jgi:nucleotide-binding universal stress UspA family protein
MEKILLAIDAAHLNMPAVEFACYIASLTNSKVTGVFLENLVASEKAVLKQAYGAPYLDWETDENSAEYVEKVQLIEKNIQYFKQACENRSARCNIHRDRGTPAHELITESRYADLIVVDAATSFSKTYDGAPTQFVKDILQDAECPVILAPQGFEGIDEIIFAYDSSKSAAFAIKQFTYLFPQFDDRKVTIVQVNKEGVWADSDKYNLREWLQNRYSAIGFEALKGDSTDKLFDYFFKRKNAFIVMGAYGRNSLSRFFKPSHADILIKTITQPIFIAHY